jgi:probable HAF family extracellular repeat protein
VLRDRPANNGINEAGQIVGTAYIDDLSSSHTHAFLYSGRHMLDLGTLGGSDSVATGINNRGQIVGYVITSTALTTPFCTATGKC